MKSSVTRGLWLSVAAALAITTCLLLKMIIDGSLIAVILTPIAAMVSMNIFENQLNKKQ